MHLIKHATLHSLSASHIERWAYLFILFYMLAWTIAPTYMRYTLPLDALEGATWGHQLEWGYDKNPFVNAWLTALAVKIGKESGWTIYFLSQLSVGLCFWAVWQLGKKMLPPIYAFIAIILLAGTQYYNLHAIDFNDNTIELSLWALTTLFFYQALQQNKMKDWLLTGLFAGLSMMTKYYAAILLLSMLIFMLSYPQTRRQFKQLPLYYGLILFVLIILPHTIWLFHHDFITVQYAFKRVSTKYPHWLDHVFYPSRFAWQQFEVFFPALVLFLFLVLGKKQPANPDKQVHISSYNMWFLLVIGLGPFILTLLLSAFTGIKLRAGWGQPLLTFWSLMLLAWFLPLITLARFKRFLIASITLLTVTISIYCITILRAKHAISANFPGKMIATQLERDWVNTYHRPLTYVVGARWLAGNVSFYSQSKPSVYIEANKKLSPWIDEEKMKQNGAIFVWDPTDKHQMPMSEIKKRYPSLGETRVMHFSWWRNPTLPPAVIIVAFLAPQSRGC